MERPRHRAGRHRSRVGRAKLSSIYLGVAHPNSRPLKAPHERHQRCAFRSVRELIPTEGNLTRIHPKLERYLLQVTDRDGPKEI